MTFNNFYNYSSLKIFKEIYKCLFDPQVLEITIFFANKYPLNVEEIIFSDLWISNRRFSSYEKFTSIFLIFKIFEKIVSFLPNFHGISSIILQCVQLRIQFSQNRVLWPIRFVSSVWVTRIRPRALFTSWMKSNSDFYFPLSLQMGLPVNSRFRDSFHSPFQGVRKTHM